MEKEVRNSSIFLRPRFKIEVDEGSETIKKKFTDSFKKEKGIIWRISNNYIVVDVCKEESHFWTPQLSLEIESISKKTSLIKGLFGPKPHIWTLFMFFHFVLAVCFIASLVSLYVLKTLNSNTTIALWCTIIIPVLWISFYLTGRLGRVRGREQMRKLSRLVTEIYQIKE